MSPLFALFGCVGEAGLIFALVILLQLSKKLGEVTKMKPVYRGYYVAMLMLFLAFALRAIHASVGMSLGTSGAGAASPASPAVDNSRLGSSVSAGSATTGSDRRNISVSIVIRISSETNGMPRRLPV